MKLISCYIESYGAIKKKNIVFDGNLTSVCEANGYGKTTLASFLEAMFYGMDSDRANSRDFGPRRHFNPFDGGHFGGNVVFSIGSDIYKIERYFDEKSESKDSLTVYKNSERYTGLGTQIGEKIFGIDRASFERTILISSREIEISSTGSINAKLNRFVEGGTDDTNTDIALERLEKAAKEYKKSKAGNDLITRESSYLLKLNESIDNLKNIKASLPEKYGRLAEYENKLKELQKNLDNTQQIEIALKDWEQYDALLSSASSNQQIAEELDKKYPSGIPSAAELADLREALSARATLQEQTHTGLSREDTESLSVLSQKFASGVPTEGSFTEIAEKIGKLTAAEAELHSEESGRAAEYETYLRNRFAEHAPTEQTLGMIDAAFAEYVSAEKLYAETPDYTIGDVERTDDGKTSTDKKKYLIAAIVAAILVAVGIGIIFVALIPGVVIMGVGVVLLILTGFIYLNKKTSVFSGSGAVQKLNPEKLARERERNSTELKVQQLLARYGYSPDKNVQYLVERFKSDYEAYVKLLSSDRERDDRLAVKREQCVAFSKEVCEYFALYGLTGNDFNRMLAELQKEVSKYTTLVQTQAKLKEQNAALDRKIAEQEQVIHQFCTKYHIDPLAVEDAFDQIESDVALYTQAKKEHAVYLRKAEEFQARKGLKVRPVKADDAETEEIRATIAQLSKERSALGLEIADCETEAEKLDDLYAEVQRHTELLQEYRKNHAILILTAELLKKADKQLKDKYVAPVKDNFVSYAALLETALGEKVVMTPNFEIRYERGGIERSERHLSAGQRSICAFCFRMALIENMYADEKPFLILDDPFVSLDQKHMDRVKIILQKISERMQIIYFTCHESRAV